MNKRTVNITPSPRLMDIIGATSFSVADAIAEIVANSFDAMPEGRQADIKVIISESAGEIAIIDNGKGMQESVLEDALSLGVDMGHISHSGKARKGHFGLGMKTACASLGYWWGIYTRPEGDEHEYRVFFDIKEWNARTRESKSWTADIETHTPDTTGYLRDAPYGTAIVIRQLRNKRILQGPVFDKLGQAFKAHLEQGDVIMVGDEPVKSKSYRFVDGSKVPIELNLGPSDKYRITGWVAIDEQTHNDGNYGLNIYRMRQLLEPWNKDWIRAHLMCSRIIGDVHLDFIDANFFKKGIQVQSVEWDLVKERMKIFMKPVVTASEKLSKEQNIKSPQMRRNIINEMRKKMGFPIIPGQAVESTVPKYQTPGVVSAPPGIPDTEGTGPDSLDVAVTPPPILIVKLTSIKLEDGIEIKLRGVEEALPSSKTPWDYLYEEDPKEIKVVLNTQSEIYKLTKYQDRAALMKFAMADAIVGFLVEQRNISLKKAKEARNDWIFQSMTISTSSGV